MIKTPKNNRETKTAHKKHGYMQSLTFSNKQLLKTQKTPIKTKKITVHIDKLTMYRSKLKSIYFEFSCGENKKNISSLKLSNRKFRLSISEVEKSISMTIYKKEGEHSTKSTVLAMKKKKIENLITPKTILFYSLKSNLVCELGIKISIERDYFSHRNSNYSRNIKKIRLLKQNSKIKLEKDFFKDRFSLSSKYSETNTNIQNKLKIYQSNKLMTPVNRKIDSCQFQDKNGNVIQNNFYSEKLNASQPIIIKTDEMECFFRRDSRECSPASLSEKIKKSNSEFSYLWFLSSCLKEKSYDGFLSKSRIGPALLRS